MFCPENFISFIFCFGINLGHLFIVSDEIAFLFYLVFEYQFSISSEKVAKQGLFLYIVNYMDL